MATFDNAQIDLIPSFVLSDYFDKADDHSTKNIAHTAGDNEEQPLEAARKPSNASRIAGTLPVSLSGPSSLPEPDIQNTVQPNHSHLLSLPKELRLEIWKYVLTDPCNARLVLRIMRATGEPNTSGKRFANSLYKHQSTPDIRTSFEIPPTSPICVALLQTNHFIYEEALPILYQSVSFCPWHLEGIFPLFLNKLSEFAVRNIRYVRLIIRKAVHDDNSHLYWPVTCAQVAKLNGYVSLRAIEVHADLCVLDNERFLKRAILFPLLKIKAPKVFIGTSQTIFQRRLAEAAAEREAREVQRRLAAEADASKRTSLAILTRSNNDQPPIKRQRMHDLILRGKGEEHINSPVVDDREVDYELAGNGSQPCQNDLYLSDWDMISVRSKSPCPSFHTTNHANEEEWVDTVSTSLGKHEDDLLSNEDSDEWEIVDGMNS